MREFVKNSAKRDQKDPENYFEEYEYMEDGNKIFVVQKFALHPEAPYASVSWLVNPGKHTSYYIDEVVKFYNALKAGLYEPSTKLYPEITYSVFEKRNLNTGVVFEPDLDNLLSELQSEGIISEQNKLNAHDVRIISRFGHIAMIGYGRAKWFPKNSSLNVMSHLDISEPLSEFIMSTSRYNVRPEEIKQYFTEIFTFDGVTS